VAKRSFQSIEKSPGSVSNICTPKMVRRNAAHQ
jgi:hypothetical protein